MKTKYKKFLDFGKSLLFIFIGEIMITFAINLFLIPYHLLPGGVTGIGDMLSRITPLSIGTWILIINIPLFILGLRIIGREFFIKSLVGLIFDSIFTDAFSWARHLDLGFDNDYMLCALFGGVIIGIGYGIVFRAGGSSGGTDISACLIKHWVPNAKLGRIILCCDLVIISVQGIVFGNVKFCLYATVVLFCSSRMVDIITEGGQGAKLAYVISDKSTEIAQRIIKEMEHGVTKFSGVGMYTNKRRDILMCTMYKQNVTHFKKIVSETDPDAFVTISDTREVGGEGFTVLKK